MGKYGSGISFQRQCMYEKEAIKEALKGNDVDDIKAKTENLNKKAMELAGKVYEAQAKANQEKEATKEDNKDDDGAEEATYEEKK